MKILFDHRLPFSFAHGGAQIQIHQTKATLEKIGVQVEYGEFQGTGELECEFQKFGAVKVVVGKLKKCL
jgi:hypothetical protein